MSARPLSSVPGQLLGWSRGVLPALLVAALVAGCGGGSDDPEGDSSGATSTTPTASTATDEDTEATEPYLPVPDGVELTAPGSELEVGETATVAYEFRQDAVGVLEITVRRLEETSIKQSFAGWQVDDKTRKATPYFVQARVKNVGDTDLGGRRIPLYIVDGDNTLVESASFASKFEACPSTGFPESFETGDKVDACLVYLAPDKGELTAVSFRPTQEFDPITWTGEVGKLGEKDDKRKGGKAGEKDKGKGEADSMGSKGRQGG